MNKSNFLKLTTIQFALCFLAAILFELITTTKGFNGVIVSLITFIIYSSTSSISLFTGSEKIDFVQRILLMITLQILFFLTVALAIIYTQDGYLTILFFLGLFLLLLVVQTLTLIRFQN